MALINPVTVDLFLKYVLPAIPQVIQLAEQAFPAAKGKKTGTKKKAAVLKTVTTIAKAAGLANELSKISKTVGKQIDDHVADLNGSPG